MDMRLRNAVSWNSMINGYGQNGNSEEALKLFNRKLDEGLEVTDVTIMGALYACGELGDLEEGRRVHEMLNGRFDDAARLFYKMRQENVKPSAFTMVGVIPALADVSNLRQAKWIHGYAIRLCFDQNIYFLTALVDMYTKCGGVSMACKLFDLTKERHVSTWNAITDGYGSHGLGKDAVELFEQMKRSPMKPNDIAVVCILSACSHSGLADEGRKYFKSMKDVYGIKPARDHYGSMVDLLGRAGMLDEARNFIQSMPIDPGISVYGAMLGACKIHKNVQFAEAAAKRIFELCPKEGGYHVLLARVYANASMWQDVARVRNMMEKKWAAEDSRLQLYSVEERGAYLLFWKYESLASRGCKAAAAQQP